MATPNQPPDPPPSISATELRRRLLASTPPPMAAGASSVNIDLDSMAAAAATPASKSNWGADALIKLRLPGQHAATPALAEPEPNPSPFHPQAQINKRTPVVGMRMQNLDSSGFVPEQSGPPRGTGSGPIRHPASRTTDDNPTAEIARLRSENKEIRQLLQDMKHLLQEASDSEQRYANREGEFQNALAERQRQIDELSEQLQTIEEQIASGTLTHQAPQAAPKSRTELEEWGDELEKESSRVTQDRKRLESERTQLREDEDALEKQMRDMEVSMARERAIMARQETELKRLSAEIQHELELLQRGDTVLRDQMQKFQRRAQDVMLQGKGAPPPRR